MESCCGFGHDTFRVAKHKSFVGVLEIYSWLRERKKERMSCRGVRFHHGFNLDPRLLACKAADYRTLQIIKRSLLSTFLFRPSLSQPYASGRDAPAFRSVCSRHSIVVSSPDRDHGSSADLQGFPLWVDSALDSPWPVGCHGRPLQSLRNSGRRWWVLILSLQVFWRENVLEFSDAVASSTSLTVFWAYLYNALVLLLAKDCPQSFTVCAKNNLTGRLTCSAQVARFTGFAAVTWCSDFCSATSVHESWWSGLIYSLLFYLQQVSSLAHPRETEICW